MISIEIVLEQEGGRVLDKLNIDEKVIEEIQKVSGENKFKCLSFVDLYGDTIFNNAQSREIIEECDILKKKIKKKEILQALDKIKNLAERCSKEIHTYLKFIGN